jgi:hypothetical protein
MNKSKEEEEEEEEDEVAWVSTLNLMEFAGSESTCHTGATGERQKNQMKD